MNVMVRAGGSDRGDTLIRRLRGPLLALGAVLAFGTLGYMTLEGWSLLDAAYMAVITITTVGFGEVHPLSSGGRLFTIALILLGVGALSYTFTVVISMIVDGQLTRQWEARQMEQRLSQLSEHYILCGYGRVGRQIARDFQRQRVPFVVIDVNQASLDLAAAEGLAIVYGNATEDDVLHRAGIARAAGLIAAIADDADNIFVTLSAQALRPALPIVARANYDDAVHKLRRAGASHVVSPYAMAGQQMALLAVRPAAVDFVETLLYGTGGNLLLEDVRILDGAPLVGRSVATARARFASGATLLALRRAGQLLAPPPVDTTLQADDILVLVGTDAQLREVEAACTGQSTRSDLTARD